MAIYSILTMPKWHTRDYNIAKKPGVTPASGEMNILSDDA
jgi:hypothetical protein